MKKILLIALAIFAWASVEATVYVIPEPVSVQEAYRLDPYDRLFAHERERVIGVQANVWTEFMADFERVQFALLPRLAKTVRLYLSDMK